VLAENWKAIEKSQTIQLEDTDRTLLDKIQNRLALSDRDFLHLLVVIGKVAPTGARLAGVHLALPL